MSLTVTYQMGSSEWCFVHICIAFHLGLMA